MSDNRWQRVEEIFHRAVELGPKARSAFLDEACAADQSLRREVESLLAHESEDGTTFVGPAGDDAPRTIAHYRISGKLGQGGMGTVYRATDTKLGREVAIKVLPSFFAEDADEMARFTREAKVLASLNHPNIAQIYGIEERALVMELVPGETLKRPLPIETALDYAKQIAEALEAAHEKGIVHRDLKPANVVVTPEGVVKVLDFGLAAVVRDSLTDASDPVNSPSLTMRATQAGMIMGTAAYMSPEQAAGKPVDKRADIWSFGAVLWELLTGHGLFEGETLTQTLAEVLRCPIDFDQLPRETPVAIRGLLRRCLDRNAKNRLRDIGEARIAIEAALAGETPLLEGVPTAGGARRLWLAWGVAAALAMGLAAVSFRYFRETPPAPGVPIRFQIPPPENTTLQPWPAISPDGRKVALMGLGGRMWVHFLESGETRDLMVRAGTMPFWSADSRFLAYPSGSELTKIEVTGGPSQTVAHLPGPWGGGAWNQDDVIVFADQRAGLFRVSASGGVPVPITAVDPARQETIHFGPSFLPDGRHFVYTRLSTDGKKSAIYLGSVDAKPGQQSSKPLIASTWQAVCAPSADPSTGYLLFMREGVLMAQPFDNRSLELRGQAVLVAEDVNDTGATAAAWGSFGTGGWGAFSASANGALAFQPSTASDRQLTWYDREGNILGTVGEPGDYRDFALSPDGTRLAVSKSRGQAASIWLLDLSRGGASTRFTFGSASDTNPLWSPDGSRIIFSSNRDGPYNLYQKPVNSSKGEEVLFQSGENKQPTSWSHDGRFLLYTVVHPETMMDIWVLPLEGERKPVPFLATRFNEGAARFSPDSHWVAYASNESGHAEVYVRPFSMNYAGTAVEEGGKWQISNGFGRDPRWRGDGRELYYRSRDGGVMAVEIATSPAFRAGKPRPVGPSPDPQRPVPLGLWDSTADGKFFLAPPVKSRPEAYTVVLNWQAGLKK
jgi:Tol biopolymer transport system component/predicted Ser/Thr protein kinase